MKSELPGTCASFACFADYTLRTEHFPICWLVCVFFHGCRSIWRLCRSSSQRWPSGTHVSPAPARVRMDSPEVWEPSASWTTASQRPAWTDRRGRTALWGAEMTATGIEPGSRGHCSQENCRGRPPSSEMLGFVAGYSRKFAFLLLEINKSPCVFINPMVLTCFMSIYEINTGNSLSCIQKDSRSKKKCGRNVCFIFWGSVQTRILDWLLFHRQQAKANPLWSLSCHEHWLRKNTLLESDIWITLGVLECSPMMNSVSMVIKTGCLELWIQAFDRMLYMFLHTRLLVCSSLQQPTLTVLVDCIWHCKGYQLGK